MDSWTASTHYNVHELQVFYYVYREYLCSMSFYEHAVYPVMQNERHEVDEHPAL